MKFLNTVPDGYIYTSPSDVAYQKCGADWVKCSSGELVESRKIPKLELASKHQIMECNEFSRFQVGSSYTLDNAVYTYIGSKNFTINGALLSESTSGSVYSKLTEDDENVDSVEIPFGYVYSTPKGNSYVKKKKGWQSLKSENFLNSSSAASLEEAAKRKISEFNKDASTPIGWKWKSRKGNEYIYVGNGNFFDVNGKVQVPKHIAEQLLASNEHNQKANKQAEELKKASEPSDNGIDLQPDAFDSEETTKDVVSEPESKPAESGQAGSDIEQLAQTIKNHPAARKITILLSRGDDVSLLAADILLSGKTKEAVDILNALNKG